MAGSKVGQPTSSTSAAEGPAGETAQARAAIAALVAQGRACEGSGDHQSATRCLQKATALAQALDDPALVAELMVECSAVFAGLGEFRLASRFLERAREVAADHNLEELKGEVYRGFGALYKARGDFAHAAVSYDRALEKLEFSSRHRSVCLVLLDVSELYLREGRGAPAQNLLRRAENLPASAEPALQVRLRLNLGRLAYLSGDLAQALDSYESAAKIARSAERDFERELVCLGLAGLYLEDGRVAPAIRALREALALSIVSFSREPLERLERARFLAMGQRLLEIDVADERLAPAVGHRREVDEAVRLFNAHPLVLTGKIQRYGAVTALVQAADPVPASQALAAPAAETPAKTWHPNPK